MKPIDAFFQADVFCQQQKCSNTHGKPGDIDGGIYLVAKDISEGNFYKVFKHGKLFMSYKLLVKMYDIGYSTFHLFFDGKPFVLLTLQTLHRVT